MNDKINYVVWKIGWWGGNYFCFWWCGCSARLGGAEAESRKTLLTLDCWVDWVAPRIFKINRCADVVDIYRFKLSKLPYELLSLGKCENVGKSHCNECWRDGQDTRQVTVSLLFFTLQTWCHHFVITDQPSEDVAVTAAAEDVVRMLGREQINIRLRNIDIWTPRAETHTYV